MNYHISKSLHFQFLRLILGISHINFEMTFAYVRIKPVWNMVVQVIVSG